MDLGSRVELNNGVLMPWVGFGTFRIPDGKDVEDAVSSALEAGYRSIDTASYYGNERGVGLAIRESGLDRKDIFLTTKVWIDEQGYDGTKDAMARSLERLGMDYVDLYLVHWPRRGMIEDTWKAMEDILQEGLARSIGVSNFLLGHLNELYRTCKTMPAIDQIEFHPYLYPIELLDHCMDKGIRVEAWSPLMQGHVTELEELKELSDYYGRSIPQITLRWDLQHGVVTIPKSTHKDRILENAEIFDFEIEERHMRLIDSLNREKRFGPDPNIMYAR
ncbi:MAG: aldo/keto reductase [Candidatus Methanofastidiosa archaeon]|nr:aldo/keto reductase [Candidatus Methanofastidiosa archaeon]